MKRAIGVPVQLLVVMFAIPLLLQLVFSVFIFDSLSKIASRNSALSTNAAHIRDVNQLSVLSADALCAAIMGGSRDSLPGSDRLPERIAKGEQIVQTLKSFEQTHHQSKSFSDLWRGVKQEVRALAQRPDLQEGKDRAVLANDELVDVSAMVLRDLESAQNALVTAQQQAAVAIANAMVLDFIFFLGALAASYFCFARMVSLPVRRVVDRLSEASLHSAAGADDDWRSDDIARVNDLSKTLVSEVHELRFREVSLAANSKQIIVSLDRNSKIKKSNPFTREFFKLSTDVPELRLVDYLGDDADYFAQTLMDMSENDEPLRKIELSAQDGAGRIRDLEWTLAWSKSDSSFFCVANDVTSTRQADRFKDEMLMTLSHDIRSPLAAVTTTIERMVRLEESAASSKDKLMAIKKTLMSIASLSEDLLDIDQLQTGQMKLEVNAVSALQVVNEVVESLRGLVEEKGISVRINSTEDVRILCDPSRVKQVLGNILSNAIKFSPPGSDIKIEWVAEPGHLSISVEDSGSGIAESVQSAILTGTAVTSESGGRGIGLRISKMLIERMGGKIGLNSSSAGTRVWLRLPVA